MQFNIPDTGQKRVVIVGAGFGGLTLSRQLAKSDFQVVLVDKNNYHQFQPLFYQVAMAGLEPSSIAFPLRKVFQNSKNVFVRVTKVLSVQPEQNQLVTEVGSLRYDYLVLAIGADTNWYGNEQIRANAIPMKAVNEALFLRNSLFEDYERATIADNYDQRQPYLDIVVVGGGPTGVELAGSLAEMKKHIIAKDYNDDLKSEEIDIHLIHGDPRLLNTMSPQASAKAETYLRELGVQLWLDKVVTGYDGQTVTVDDGSTIRTDKVIWAAGITGNKLEGIPATVVARGNRLKVNGFNRLEDSENIFAIGDIALQIEGKWTNGHPQVAQVALQQGKLLGKNLRRLENGEAPRDFHYRDLGSMATIGRNKAVVDLPFWRFQGAFAWLVWLFVHLFAILGAKNKVFVFLNWVWNYFSYDQSLRLVIKPWKKPIAVPAPVQQVQPPVLKN